LLFNGPCMQQPQTSFCRRLSIACFAAILSACALPASAAQTPAHVGYNRDIRPILSDNCFACHGPDRNKRKAKLRLDDRDIALDKKAIIPGKPADSEMIHRIYSTDPEKQMPPPESNKKLTETQKKLLEQWIAQGAEYEPFWAYQTPKRPPVPTVKEKDWVVNPIDAFVLEQLEARHIAHSPPADRRTLLRRLSLDLIGLPPTPEETLAFLNDKSPDAYAKQVDRLLANPHFGERMAVPWLDAVRFADTVGFHGDQNQNIFPYRDYVINAFNSNKPFDQFTIEQLAGDLLPHPTTEQLVATGFNRLNMMTREGGAQPKEYLAKYMADRVRTIGSCFLGATLGCCECHDHKYDPFTARDFYSMGAYFADIKQWGVYMDYTYTPNPDLKGFSNDHPFPPEIVVDSPYLKTRRQRLLRQIDQLVATWETNAKQDGGASKALSDWRKNATAFLAEHPDGWEIVKPIASVDASRKSNGIEVLENDAVQFDSNRAAADRIEFALTGGSIAALRLELLPTEKHHERVLRGNADSATVSFTASIKHADGKRDSRLKIYFADADEKAERYSNGYAILGVQGGWKTSPDHVGEKQDAAYILDQPIQVTSGDKLVLSLGRDAVGCVRVSVSPMAPFTPTDPSFAPALADALGQDPSGTDHDPLLVGRTFLLSTDVDPKEKAAIRALHEQVRECRNGKSPTLVTEAMTPYVVRVLPRGNWQDQSGAIVEPMPPHFLPQPKIEGRHQTRLDLAKWIVSPENPLTSRVIVNRFWKQFFGSGICDSIQDFGAQGEWPSHPELLDWLAVEFRESGWNMKHMIRLMVMSNTYQQQSGLRPELRNVDPQNRLLSCQSPRRLEAEFVRDNALAISGLICLDIGGPSVFPYQPAGYYANIQFPNRDYISDTDDREYRRGVYMHWQRTFLHPMLANFDAPSREDSVCTRNVSNTPQQALTLLNDPEFVECARVLAQKILPTASSDKERIDAIYLRALDRDPKAEESQSLLQFLAGQRSYYRDNPADAEKLIHVGIAAVPNEDPVELAAWTSVCRVVLNLHETITRY